MVDTHHPSLYWEKGKNLERIALNLRAQWAKNLKVDVELLSGASAKAKAPLRLVTYKKDPYEPVPPLDNAIYLFEQGRALLKSPRLKPLPESAEGDWNFAAIDWS